MMKAKRAKLVWIIAALSVFGIVCSCGCAAENNDPVISGLYADSNMLSPGHSSTIAAVASDPDGDELQYQWFVSEGDIPGEGSEITWTAPLVPGAYTITAVVTDGRDGRSAMTITLGVAPGSDPVIVSFEAADTGCKKSTPVAIDCLAYDRDGDELTYEWSATGGEITGEGPFVSWVAPEELGTYTITVYVSDGTGGEVEESLEIEVKGG
ncbi:MAG: hypothetical protein PHY18_04325 [Dehalococcoidales bacterium]|nr:hypothetical protein [Dehalococcoidales bacterium]